MYIFHLDLEDHAFAKKPHHVAHLYLFVFLLSILAFAELTTDSTTINETAYYGVNNSQTVEVSCRH